MWLWWRRQAFYLQRLSLWKLLFLLFCILIIIAKLPNPFSSKYKRILIKQDVSWDHVSHMLEMKEKVTIL